MNYFYEDGTAITLNPNKKFASGGEGSIFMHPKNKQKCIKIYHTPKSASIVDSYKQLGALNSTYFIKPEKMLFSPKGELAGFEMQYIDINNFFILKKLMTKSFCDQNNFDRTFKYNVYLNLKKAIEDAHNKNIVIGDLNPYNILFDKLANIYFVDVDSFATKHKPHSGVLLEDIRDWILHPQINHQTDAFAFDVLVFWMFTYLHPYRGTTKLYKNLEERVIKNASVLQPNKIPDLITPPVYEKFTNQHILNQFEEVFEKRKRFLVDLGNASVVPQNVPAFQPINLNSSDLFIRIIAEDIVWADASLGLLAVKYKSGAYKVFNLANYGVCSEVESFTADEVFLGNNNYVKKRQNRLYFGNNYLVNVDLPSNSLSINTNNTLFVLDQDSNYAWKFAIDNIINNNIQSEKIEIYSPSVQVTDGAVLCFIGDSYWLFLPNKTLHNTIKTNLKIKNAYYKNGFYCLETVDKGQVNFGIYKVVNNTLEFIYQLNEFSYFDMKGEYLFIPQTNKIELIFIPRKELVMTIDCPVCKPDSKIFQTNAGMIILDNNKIYFVNKKK